MGQAADHRQPGLRSGVRPGASGSANRVVRGLTGRPAFEVIRPPQRRSEGRGGPRRWAERDATVRGDPSRSAADCRCSTASGAPPQVPRSTRGARRRRRPLHRRPGATSCIPDHAMGRHPRLPCSAVSRPTSGSTQRVDASHTRPVVGVGGTATGSRRRGVAPRVVKSGRQVQRVGQARMLPVVRYRSCQPSASPMRCGVCLPGDSARARWW